MLGPSSSLPESGWRTGPIRAPKRHPAINRMAPGDCFLLGLAPGGVCLARLVAQPAGELLPHRFTLTARTNLRSSARRFAFCCTFPDLAAGGRYPPPCPAEPGLSSRRDFSAGDRPVRSETFSCSSLILLRQCVRSSPRMCRWARLQTLRHFSLELEPKSPKPTPPGGRPILARRGACSLYRRRRLRTS